MSGYFEDEDGLALDDIGLAQVLTGEEYPILPGNPASVLRLGPTGMRDHDRWSVQAANDIAHLLQLVRQIAGSDWLSSPLSLRSMVEAGGIKTVLDFDAPNEQKTAGVLLPIRQLISGDDAFNIACNWYVKHAADSRKRAWVQERKAKFNEFRRSPPGLTRVGDYSNQQIIALVMYGSGLVHRASNDGREAELTRLVSEVGREPVVMAFNVACRFACQYAFDVYHVVQQDFAHWVDVEGQPGPDRVGVVELFGRGRVT